MEPYKIVVDGKSIQHIINIPPEYVHMDLEITIKPVKSGEAIKKKIESIQDKHKKVKPFHSITDPVEWQKDIRNDW